MSYFVVQNLDMWGGDIKACGADTYQEALTVAKSMIGFDPSDVRLSVLISRINQNILFILK